MGIFIGNLEYSSIEIALCNCCIIRKKWVALEFCIRFQIVWYFLTNTVLRVYTEHKALQKILPYYNSVII